MASLMAAARGHGFKSGSLSFRAARIVAAKRIANFRSSVTESSSGNGGQQGNMKESRLQFLELMTESM